MVPRTFPSTYETVNGETRMVVFFLSSVSGLTKWVDYIPVKFPMLETQDSNSYNNDGVILVDPLSSTTNRQAWIDYIPVFVDANDTAAWRVDANGYIPVGFAVKPTLNLDFASTKTLDPRITFSRASSATYFDADGVLQTAASGVARFDHNPTTGESLGLLVEEQRTNLLTYSSEFDDAAWTKTRSSITANTIVAPDGTLTGDKMVEDTTASNTHVITQSASYTSGTSYSFSVYAKAAERTSLSLQFPSGQFGASVTVSFNLSAVTATVAISGTGTSGTITAVGNGWYRCVAISQATSSGTANIPILLENTPNNRVYTGNGYSGIYIWGAQLEAGAFPTSYIPTVAATVTRNADAATMTGTNFSSWYRADEGTFYADWIAGADTDFINAFSVGSTVVNGGFMNIRRGSSGNLVAAVVDGISTQAGITVITGAPVAGTGYKATAAFKVNDFAATSNGATPGTDTSGTVPSTIGTLVIGNGWNNPSGIVANEYLNSHIRKLAFYPSRLSNAQLQALTR